MNIRLQSNDGGELAIEETAIRSIVELAIKEIGDGATKVNKRFLLGNAIRVKEGQDKKLVVDLELTVPYGVHLPDAMRELQDGVRGALTKNLGVQNSVVNVVVTKVAVTDGAERSSST